MVKKLVIWITLFASFVIRPAYSQTDKQVVTQISWALIEHYNTLGADVFEKKAYKNHAFTFGFAIRTNDKGRIDTVIFTNKTPLLDSLVSFSSITKTLKGKRASTAFSKYKNTLFIAVALVRKSVDQQIDNTETFDTYFYNLMPDVSAIGNKHQTILLPAFSMVQGRRQP